ncbi:MAG: hypothetical protein NVS9B8_17770 [Candidatus Limnocylindrales bacterium]
MGSGDGSRNPLRRAVRSWPKLRRPAAIGAWLVVGLIVLSGIVSAAVPGSTRLRATREVSGTVTVVNHNGSAFCLDTDGSGVQFCSEPYQRVGSGPLVVGQHVTGTVALLSTGPTRATEVFILTDPQPTP